MQLRLTFVINPEDKVGICLCMIDYTLFPSCNLQTVNGKCGEERRAQEIFHRPLMQTHACKSHRKSGMMDESYCLTAEEKKDFGLRCLLL